MKTVVEAKVFKNGGSNAIRIPAAFKIENEVVFLTIDDESEQITLSRQRPKPFAKLFELLDKHGPISDEDWDFERDNSIEPMRKSLQELMGE